MRFLLMVMLLCVQSFLLSASYDPSSGVGYNGSSPDEKVEIYIPDNFDVNHANDMMIRAKEIGDMETANSLSRQIHQWWNDNRGNMYNPDLCGSSPNLNLNRNENHQPEIKLPDFYAPLWGTDVRIDPRDNIYSPHIVSLSNGHLYVTSVMYSPGNDYFILTHRSTDGGHSWFVCDSLQFSNPVYEPRLSIADDTLIHYYVMQNSSNQYQTWVRVMEPGASLNPIYWGSPSGGYVNDIITDLWVTNDGPNFDSKWIYATWNYSNIAGEDTTWLMFARSSNMDVSSWDIQDTIEYISGDNTYYRWNKIENGNSTNLIIVTMIHPSGYPVSNDEFIIAWQSTNGGSSWSTPFSITPNDNHKDEYLPALAGSHSNNNWVCIVTQKDTVIAGNSDRNLINYYSTDNGNTWNVQNWELTDSNYNPYVMVDYNSTAFYAVFRKDITAGFDYVVFRQGDINDPTSWTPSQDNIVNDYYGNLNDRVPTVCYDYTADGVCVAWTSYQSVINSIWFDNKSWSNSVEEEPVAGDLDAERFSVVQNGKSFRVKYSVTSPGNISINIFDISGRNVVNLLNERKETGSYSLDYEPDFTSGLYFFTIQTNQSIQTRSIYFIK